MTRKHRRMTILGAGIACLAVATALVLIALENRVTFFYSPSELLAAELEPGTRVRLGGLVVDGSIGKLDDGLVTRFDLADGIATMPVRYAGILPDLFREGQGIVATGTLDGAGGIFVADEVLAKHDETYMPPEVAEALRETGHWRGDGAPP